MATKNDLIEAQNFSRKRLLTAFVSGAPGGKELQPAAPLRAVVAAIALTAAVLLAGVFIGLIKPGLPQGWQNGRMVLAKDTGARYVTVGGVLHPVLNTASARLLIPSKDFAIVTTDQKTLSSIKLGSTLGIVGAPDSLPAPANLVQGGWSACATDDGGTDLQLGGGHASATSDATVVVSDGVRYVIDGGRRYAVDPDQSDAVLRAVGIASLDPAPVSAAWLNLFAPGTPLQPIVIDNAGLPLSGTSLTIGQAVHIKGSPADQRFVVQPDGSLAALTPLAWQLFQLGSGRQAGTVTDVSAADVAGRPTSAHPIGGADWPHQGFTALPSSQRPCAVLQRSGSTTATALASEDSSVAATAGVHVPAGHGALVRSGGRGDQSSGLVTLVDATGTAYALPGATAETVQRLGYTAPEIVSVDQDWLRLFPAGPALTTQAAGQTPKPSGNG